MPLLQGCCSVVLALEKLGLLNDSEYQRLKPGAAQIRWVSAWGHIHIIYTYMYMYTM